MSTKLHDIRTYLNAQFVERTDVIDGLLTALVAKVHVLLIGPPGTAKSAITVALSQCIDDANYFQWLLTKFSTPEELFGPYDLAKLKQGAYERITAGKLPVANLAYLYKLNGRSSVWKEGFTRSPPNVQSIQSSGGDTRWRKRELSKRSKSKFGARRTVECMNAYRRYTFGYCECRSSKSR